MMNEQRIANEEGEGRPPRANGEDWLSTPDSEGFTLEGSVPRSYGVALVNATRYALENFRDGQNESMADRVVVHPPNWTFNGAEAVENTPEDISEEEAMKRHTKKLRDDNNNSWKKNSPAPPVDVALPLRAYRPWTINTTLPINTAEAAPPVNDYHIPNTGITAIPAVNGGISNSLVTSEGIQYRWVVDTGRWERGEVAPPPLTIVVNGEEMIADFTVDTISSHYVMVNTTMIHEIGDMFTIAGRVWGVISVTDNVVTLRLRTNNEEETD